MQLVTWEPYLLRLREAGLLLGRHAIVHCTNQYPISRIHDDWPWHLMDEIANAQQGKQLVLIMDSHTEAPSWRHVAAVVHRMRERYHIDPQCVIQWTGAATEPDSPIQTVTVMDAFSIIAWPYHCQPAPLPTHHFIMLARIPKPHRVAAAVGILRRGLQSRGHLTCGSGDHGGFVSYAYDGVPDELRGHFPLILPGEQFSATQTEEITIASTTRPEVTGAFCSVIPETSHDLMAPDVCMAFMTEKSEKCFLLEQVPIWIAAPGQVALAREWGFDTFDDIIDHTYDQESDPIRRIDLAIDQLVSICDRPIEHWQRYKLENAGRFQRNRQLCMELRAGHNEIQYRKLFDCFLRMPSAG